MITHIQYGHDGIDVEVPAHTTILAPRHIPGLADERASFHQSVAAPIGTPPLKDMVSANETVAVVIPDITRPFPSHRVLPWLFETLSHVPAGNITIINGTGSHRRNTPGELEQMVGKDLVARYRVVNHDAHDPSTMATVGVVDNGPPLMMNREYVAADRRILLGFVEPHFIAGFSGGYKAVLPGIVDIESIMHYHGGAMIGNPGSTWGVLEGNPTQEHVRAYGSALSVDFCVNVTLNRDHQITRIFAGDVLAAHDAACAFTKDTAMIECHRRYPIVITTNGGYPLDQNLYQAVKGMSAALQIVEEGGLIITAARCNDGFPEHGNFKKLLFDHDSPQALLDTVQAEGFSVFDQWEAQLLAMILVKARVALYSDISEEETRRAFLEPVSDIAYFLSEEAARHGTDTPVAVLPEGPMTIPYVG